MPALRILHLCRPAYDNLGEVAAIGSVAPMFESRGVAIERTAEDLWDNPAPTPLDDRLSEIEGRYDLVMIGPGGFLGPRLLERVFRDPASWARLRTPLCLNGVGVVASIGRPVWYSALDDASPVVRALRAASVVSVREPQSWLLAARTRGERQGEPILAGCPSISLARAEPARAKRYDLALELPFAHEVCRQHGAELLGVARAVAASGGRVLWVCHSRLDEQLARGTAEKLGLACDVVRPAGAAEAGMAYGACRAALVTRFHAGLFCLANAVPFGFVGYDVKCWHLMSMLADEPHRYILPIDGLAGMELGREVPALIERVAGAAAPFAEAERTLSAYFALQTDRVVRAMLAAAGQVGGQAAPGPS